MEGVKKFYTKRILKQINNNLVKIILEYVGLEDCLKKIALINLT
jgi:hypothetical protein